MQWSERRQYMKIIGRITMLAALLGLVAYVGTASAGGSAIFTDVTDHAGVGNKGHGKGIAFYDYNNDGYADIFVSNKGGANALYENMKDGTFTEVTDQAGVTDIGFAMGSMFGDLNNDGIPDLYVPKGGRTEIESNRLFMGLGDGKFADVTKEAGVGCKEFSYGSLMCDFDHDGKLDLLVVNYGVDQKNRLFHNISNGKDIRFEEVTDSAGLVKKGWSWSAQTADVDNDGWADLYISRGRYPAGQPNIMYLNRSTPGNIKFVDFSAESGLQDKNWALGAAFADYDNDGNVDCFLSNYVGPNKLFKGDGTGHFVETTHIAGLDDRVDHWGKGPAWGDVNNDGWLDLYEGDCKFSNQLYINNHDGTFTNATEDNPAVKLETVRTKGTAFADYDNDGDLDLYAINWAVSNKLFRNDTNNGNWLQVDVKGTVSGTDAVGAKVTVYDAGHIGDKAHMLADREVQTSTGFCSENMHVQHFGLSSDKTYDVETVYPSGLIALATDVKTGQRITMTEPTSLAMQKELYPTAKIAAGKRFPLSVAVVAPDAPAETTDVLNAKADIVE